jgi:hypothetical protein
MNTHFPRTEQKHFHYITILITLVVIIVVHFGLSGHLMSVNNLSLSSSVGQASSKNSTSQPAVFVPVPVPPASTLGNQPLATPLPPQSTQSTPQFSPEPTPPTAQVH